MARDMKRNSPIICCHFLRPTRRLSRRSSKMSSSRVRRWSGISSVCLRVSMIQPRMILRVPHAPSPFSSFLTEDGSLRPSSPAVGGWKMSSMAWSKMRRTRRRRERGPCTRAMKSSTNTSTDARGSLRGVLDGVPGGSARVSPGSGRLVCVIPSRVARISL